MILLIQTRIDGDFQTALTYPSAMKPRNAHTKMIAKLISTISIVTIRRVYMYRGERRREVLPMRSACWIQSARFTLAGMKVPAHLHIHHVTMPLLAWRSVDMVSTNSWTGLAGIPQRWGCATLNLQPWQNVTEVRGCRSPQSGRCLRCRHVLSFNGTSDGHHYTRKYDRGLLDTNGNLM